MKERPILFSAPMVRALLDGSKTQTRRVVKLRNGQYIPPSEQKDPNGWRQLLRQSPYGQRGDRLYVREAWRSTGDDGRCDAMPPRDLQPHEVWYEADGAAPADLCTGKSRRAFHMPRWASRITLEISGVRVERLHSISEVDAIAEGCKSSLHLQGGRFARENFAHLWWAINGDGAWEANPWVWVVEFKRIES